MSAVDRLEAPALAALITVAGSWVAVGTVIEQLGRATQWLGREIDKAFVGWRL